MRTDPGHKDLFVLTRTNDARVKAGVTMFASASGLMVHLDQNEQLLRERRVNYNFGTGFRGAQHGVVIQGFTPALSKIVYTRPVAGDGSSGGTPKDYLQIELAHDVPTLPAQTASWSGRKVTGPDLLVTGLAHELAHTVRVVHHGDEWDYAAVWKVRRLGTSDWTVTEVARGVEQIITVIREDGRPYPFTKEDDIGVTIGVLGGVDSGAWDCLMRYTNAPMCSRSTARCAWTSTATRSAARSSALRRREPVRTTLRARHTRGSATPAGAIASARSA